jgi:hypothetical protein
MIEVDKIKIVDYAYEYALYPNKTFSYLGNIYSGGSDCSNFVSQCIHYAGSPMNFNNPLWYYKNKNDFSISWATAHGLYWLLLENYSNNLKGPKGRVIDKSEVTPGNLVFFQKKNNFVFHSAIVTSFNNSGEPLISQHSIDALNKEINPNYYFLKMYFIEVYI